MHLTYVSLNYEKKQTQPVNANAPCGIRDHLPLTWGIRSEWGCGRTGGKLWDTCHNRAARLRSDRRRTSPHWDLPLAPSSSRIAAAPGAEGAAPCRGWSLTSGRGLVGVPSAAAVAWIAPLCCYPANWTPHWTAPAGGERGRSMQCEGQHPDTGKLSTWIKWKTFAHSCTYIPWTRLKLTLFTYKMHFILVLRLILDDNDGAGWRPSSSFGRGCRWRLRSLLPGRRPLTHTREIIGLSIITM